MENRRLTGAGWLRFNDLHLPLTLPLVFSLFLLGCGTVRNPLTIERANARTALEEKAFNVLLVSETIITSAEKSNEAGTLPEYMKPILNRLIDVHNEAKEAADNYVALLDANTEEEGFAALTALILDLDQLITSLFTGGSP